MLLVSCCNDYESTLIKKIAPEEKQKLAKHLMNGAGYKYYYQGSPSEQMLIEEAKKYDNKNSFIPRQKAIPRLTRGLPAELYPLFQEIVQLDSVEWQGYRGYYYLYNYRDYERALIDFDAVDARTPNFVDYPQTQSVDFMRAICYEQLDRPLKALEYIDKHIATEIKTVGEDYIYTVTFIVKGQAHEQLNQLAKAKTIYERAIEIHPNNADLKYYYGKLLLKLGMKNEATDVLMDCREQFKKENFNTRPYVEEFYQIYIQDIEEAEMRIDR